MLRWVTLLALATAILPQAAGAATVQEMTALVSGRAGDVACSPQSEWEALTAQYGLAASTSGLTFPKAVRVRYAPWVCQALEQGAASPRLGGALSIVAHEASHLRGVVDESVAACWGLVWAADLAQRYYGIGFFTPASIAVQASALATHRTLPARYRTICG